MKHIGHVHVFSFIGDPLIRNYLEMPHTIRTFTSTMLQFEEAF